MTDALALPPLPRTSLADAMAELIRVRIFSGAFEPGMWLVETNIARQLHTSRAPEIGRASCRERVLVAV